MSAKRLCLAALAALGLALAIASPATAQSYPDKPIKLVVPFPPGGPIDTTARRIAQHMSANLGQQVIVENRPGGGSTIAFKAVASAEPDGYTLLFGSSGSLAVAPALYVSLELSPLKAFTPVASVSLLPHVFIVPPHVPAKTVAEFIAYAKANPGKLNYGASIGTPPHLLSTLFVTKAGLDITFIPYKGSAPAVADLLGGQTHMTIDGMVNLFPMIKDGKVRALAVARAERWPALPEVPTLVESGFPDFTHDAWAGVVAPAGTSPQIVTRLNAAVNEALRSTEMQTSLARLSALPKSGSPQDFAAFIAAEMPKWAALVKLSGAKVE